jgi:pimeloyl-ACP methyl ester carboxylesterase
MRRTLAAGGLTEGRNLFEHDFRVCDAYADGLQAAARVQCPVTFILGTQDQMTPPKVTKDIAAALRARVVMLDSGHHLMAEQPDDMLAAVRAALD